MVAVAFLEKKLDYLVSSRPTAVNLADAALKLKQVIANAYIEAAENMFEDDVASNKAIGTFGSSLMRQQAKNPDKLSVLTHCNTGRYDFR
ncbi:hypothetical protein F2Q69_00050646 [Brassica cretica]|uniref:Uncharacterized protein n=1 Tax=Brassica cretica TaxID=69181 RepID=A0A8S9PJ71_BRACR|nr:hypothetical protein F2Q69_00050646 [Brassica cretica]